MTVATAAPPPVSVTSPAPPIVYVGYVGGLGGEAIQMLELAAGVAARGYDVSVVVPEMDTMQPVAARYRERHGLNIVETPLIRFNGPLGQDPRRVLGLFRQFVPKGALVHLHTGDICLPRVTLLALEILRPARAFATIHAATETMPEKGTRAFWWASAARRRLTKVLSPSRHGRQRQIDYGVPPERVVTIHNGVDVAGNARGDGAAARHELGVSADTPLVVFTSRFHSQKRPGDALDAFARVAGAFPGAHLVFVGDGPLKEAVEVDARARGLSPGRVHFLGKRSDIPDWLAAATVWVLPTRAENFSLAVIEALAAGCAVLSTKCSGNDEILANEENALVVPVGDVDALAAGLHRLLSDPVLRARLGAAGRALAPTFDLKPMIDAHLDVYGLPRSALKSGGKVAAA